MKITDVTDCVAKVIAISTGVRIGLHWFRQFLNIWISPTSKFWSFYDKLELSVAYVAGSLAVWGKKKDESTMEAPVTKAQSPAEGKIK